jgi:hypothetical protein
MADTASAAPFAVGRGGPRVPYFLRENHTSKWWRGPP